MEKKYFKILLNCVNCITCLVNFLAGRGAVRRGKGVTIVLGRRMYTCHLYYRFFFKPGMRTMKQGKP